MMDLAQRIEVWIEVLESCLPSDEEGYDDDTEQVLENVIRSMRESLSTEAKAA